MLVIGNIVAFDYPKSEGYLVPRKCAIELIRKNGAITGWDATCKGYRTFSPDKMTNIVLVGTVEK